MPPKSGSKCSRARSGGAGTSASLSLGFDTAFGAANMQLDGDSSGTVTAMGPPGEAGAGARDPDWLAWTASRRRLEASHSAASGLSQQQQQQQESGVAGLAAAGSGRGLNGDASGPLLGSGRLLDSDSGPITTTTTSASGDGHRVRRPRQGGRAAGQACLLCPLPATYEAHEAYGASVREWVALARVQPLASSRVPSRSGCA